MRMREDSFYDMIKLGVKCWQLFYEFIICIAMKMLTECGEKINYNADDGSI